MEEKNLSNNIERPFDVDIHTVRDFEDANIYFNSC